MGNGKKHKICSIIAVVVVLVTAYGIEEIDSLEASMGAKIGGTVTAKTNHASSPDSFIVKDGDNEFKSYPYSEGGVPDSVPKSHHSVESDSAGKSGNSDSLGGKAATEYTPVDTTNKYKNHTNLTNLNTSSYYHLTQTNHNDLTDGNSSTLHYHSSDRDRANHTGTQAISTVSGLQGALDSKLNISDTSVFARDVDLTAKLNKIDLDDSLSDYGITKNDITAGDDLIATDDLSVGGNGNFSGNVGIGSSASGTYSLDILHGADQNIISILRGADNTSEYVGLGVLDNVSLITAGSAGTQNVDMVFRTALSGVETEAARLKFDGSLHLSTVNNIGYDPDKYLVLDGSGNIGYRTGDQAVSDFSLFGNLSNSYVPYFDGSVLQNTSIYYSSGTGRYGLSTVTSPSATIDIESGDHTDPGLEVYNTQLMRFKYGPEGFNVSGAPIILRYTDTKELTTGISHGSFLIHFKARDNSNGYLDETWFFGLQTQHNSTWIYRSHHLTGTTKVRCYECTNTTTAFLMEWVLSDDGFGFDDGIEITVCEINCGHNGTHYGTFETDVYANLTGGTELTRGGNGYAVFGGTNDHWIMGNTGIGIQNPRCRLHVNYGESITGTDWLNGDEFALTSSDATLSLISTDGGTYGSILNFKEIGSGDQLFNFMWSILNTTSGSDRSLRFCYGTSTDPGINTNKFKLENNGNAFVYGDINIQNNVSSGSITSSANRSIMINAGDSYTASLMAYGDSQGTGLCYVGQSLTYGGWIGYWGDATPLPPPGVDSDKLVIGRRSSGNDHGVISIPYNSDKVSFAGAINIGTVADAGGSSYEFLVYDALGDVDSRDHDDAWDDIKDPTDWQGDISDSIQQFLHVDTTVRCTLYQATTYKTYWYARIIISNNVVTIAIRELKSSMTGGAGVAVLSIDYQLPEPMFDDDTYFVKIPAVIYNNGYASGILRPNIDYPNIHEFRIYDGNYNQLPTATSTVGISSITISYVHE